MNASTGPGALDGSFRLLAQTASLGAHRTDRLFIAMLVICGLMALLLLILVAGFAIRYREGSSADRSRPPSHANGLEAAWTIAPLIIFLVLFVWAADDSVQGALVPADAMPVNVVAKQWMWKLEHPSGRQEINELHVPLGRPVVLVMASQDVIHSFFVPAFRVKQDVLPGRYTRLWFTASELGEYRMLCAEYCGAQHSAMIGRVVVMTPADYARWLADGPRGTTTAAQLGAALYERLACAGCHDPASSVHAPPLAGLYGRDVSLADGSHVVADENYLREAIVSPRRHVPAGYAAQMPSYAAQLSGDDLRALVAYLRSMPREELRR